MNTKTGKIKVIFAAEGIGSPYVVEIMLPEMLPDAPLDSRALNEVRGAILRLVDKAFLSDSHVGRPDDDPVDHPAHYTGFSNGAEVIDIAENLMMNRGNAIKYLARAGAKDPAKELEDLRKAAWYVQREIERVERNGGAQ